MSIQFQSPMDEDAQRRLLEMFGRDVAAVDERTALINRLEIEGQKLKELANRTKGPVTANLHEEGEIKTMSDGTRYKVTPEGWKRL